MNFDSKSCISIENTIFDGIDVEDTWERLCTALLVVTRTTLHIQSDVKYVVLRHAGMHSLGAFAFGEVNGLVNLLPLPVRNLSKLSLALVLAANLQLLKRILARNRAPVLGTTLILRCGASVHNTQYHASSLLPTNRMYTIDILRLCHKTTVKTTVYWIHMMSTKWIQSKEANTKPEVCNEPLPAKYRHYWREGEHQSQLALFSLSHGSLHAWSSNPHRFELSMSRTSPALSDCHTQTWPI